MDEQTMNVSGQSKPLTWQRRTLKPLEKKSPTGWICYSIGMSAVFWAVVEGFDLPAWTVLKVYLILEFASGFISAFTDKD